MNDPQLQLLYRKVSAPVPANDDGDEPESRPVPWLAGFICLGIFAVVITVAAVAVNVRSNVAAYKIQQRNYLRAADRYLMVVNNRVALLHGRLAAEQWQSIAQDVAAIRRTLPQAPPAPPGSELRTLIDCVDALDGTTDALLVLLHRRDLARPQRDADTEANIRELVKLVSGLIGSCRDLIKKLDKD